MTAREMLDRYQFGLARSAADIPRLVAITTGAVLRIWPDYWATPRPGPKLLAAEINALPQRVRDFIHHLETDADPAGDKWRLAAAEENVAGLTKVIEEMQEENRYLLTKVVW